MREILGPKSNSRLMPIGPRRRRAGKGILKPNQDENLRSCSKKRRNMTSISFRSDLKNQKISKDEHKQRANFHLTTSLTENKNNRTAEIFSDRCVRRKKQSKIE